MRAFAAHTDMGVFTVVRDPGDVSGGQLGIEIAVESWRAASRRNDVFGTDDETGVSAQAESRRRTGLCAIRPDDETCAKQVIPTFDAKASRHSGRKEAHLFEAGSQTDVDSSSRRLASPMLVKLPHVSDPEFILNALELHFASPGRMKNNTPDARAEKARWKAEIANGLLHEDSAGVHAIGERALLIDQRNAQS